MCQHPFGVSHRYRSHRHANQLRNHERLVANGTRRVQDREQIVDSTLLVTVFDCDHDIPAKQIGRMPGVLRVIERSAEYVWLKVDLAVTSWECLERAGEGYRVAGFVQQPANFRDDLR